MGIQDAFNIRENEQALHDTKHDATYNSIAGSIVRHGAIKELDRFGQILANKPLSPDTNWGEQLAEDFNCPHCRASMKVLKVVEK